MAVQVQAELAVGPDVTHLTWLDALGPTAAWVAGVPPAKVSHFAAEARVTDAGDMRKMGQIKRVVLVACLVHVARPAAGTSWPRCTASGWPPSTSRPRTNSTVYESRAEAERLGDVLAAARETIGLPDDEQASGQPDDSEQVWARTGRAVLATLSDAGGVDTLSRSYETVAAFHGNNYLPFLENTDRRRWNG